MAFGNQAGDMVRVRVKNRGEKRAAGVKNA
jgi:hypothetical protein